MSKSNFSEDFKRDAVRPITERSYPVAEVSQRLGVSQHLSFASLPRFCAVAASKNSSRAPHGPLILNRAIRRTL